MSPHGDAHGNAPDDAAADRRREQLRRLLAELRAQSPDTQASSLGDYEPELAAAAARQLADEDAAFERLLPLHGDAYEAALAELDDLTAEGVRWRRELLAVDDPLLGSVDHDFRLQALLGTGGGGRVYQVERQSYAQSMALKLLAGWDQNARRRFDRERAVLARMHHPFIVQLADSWERADGRKALLMELVHGTPLVTFADQHRLGIAQRLELLGRVAQAVGYAHQLGVHHRDLKPANILVTADGTPKVLDFGIAQVLDDAGQTRTDGFVGTFAYASPEQLRRQGIDARSDVFALGVILFELLVGVRPHPGDVDRLADPLRRAPSPRAALAALPAAERDAIAERRGLGAGELHRRLGGDLAVVLDKALHVEAARRYQTVADFAADLEAVRTGRAVAARADSLWYGVRRWSARNRVAAGLAAVLLIGVPAFGVRDYLHRVQQARLAGTLAADIRAAVDEVRSFPDLPSRAVRLAREQLLRRSAVRLTKLAEQIGELETNDQNRLRNDIEMSLADIAIQAGDRDRARQHARAALALAEALPSDERESGALRRAMLAAASLVVADLEPDDGTRLAAYDRALALADDAIASAPEDLAAHLRRLTVLEHRSNHRRRTTGSLDDLAEDREWIAEAKALATRFGPHPGIDRIGVVATLREAQVAREQQRYADAALAFDDALRRLDQWPEQHLTWEILRLHARACRQRADLHLMLGEEPQSWPLFERAVTLSEAYVAQDPDDVEMLSSLATSLYYHGQALRQQQRVPEARASYERMLEVRDRLVQIDPDHRDYRTARILGVYQVADFEGAIGETGRRDERLQQACALAEELVSLPTPRTSDLDLAAELHMMIAGSRRAADAAAADTHEARAIELYERCAAGGATAAIAKLADLRAQRHERNGRWAEAASHRQQQADAARVELTAALPELLNYGQALYRLGLCHTTAGDHDSALPVWQQCSAVWRAVVDKSQDPSFRPAYRDVLLRTCKCIAALGTFADHRVFLGDAVKFCSEWRDDAKIAESIDALEAAARDAGTATDTVDAIFRREK